MTIQPMLHHHDYVMSMSYALGFIEWVRKFKQDELYLEVRVNRCGFVDAFDEHVIVGKHVL